MELGYLFHPPDNPQALGHPMLEVNLYHSPTGKHYDPRQITLPILDAVAGVQNQELFHPVEVGDRQVASGKISLLDFKDKEVEAFTFGGRLLCSNFADHSLCKLVSPAPIFNISAYEEGEAELVTEYEAELAILRARWGGEDFSLDARLAAIEPEELFLSLSASIEARLRQIPASSQTDQYWRLRHSLRAGIRFCAADGLIPPDTLLIESLLKAT